MDLQGLRFQLIDGQTIEKRRLTLILVREPIQLFQEV